MKNIILSKKFSLYILSSLFLTTFNPIQAANYYQNFCDEYDNKDDYELKQDIVDHYGANDYNIVRNESQFFVKRQGELMIPANGDCLFTSVLLGYLLPVVESENDFRKRCVSALGENEATKKLNQLWNQLKNASWNNYFQVIQSFFFKEIIKIFKTNMVIKVAWGGPKEIQILSNKLGVAIQEYIPDPEKSNQDLVGPQTTNPQTGQVVDTIAIIQDVASLNEKSYDKINSIEEVLTLHQSIKTQIHAHHFRLKISHYLTNLLKEKDKINKLNDNSVQVSVNTEYMDELKSIPFFPLGTNLDQSAPYNPLTSPKPDSLESKLATLTFSLEKLAKSKPKESKSDYSHQENNPNIDSKVPIVANSNSSQIQIGDQGNLKPLLLLCDNIEQYGKKYIQGNDLRLKVSLGMKAVKDYISKKDFLAASHKTATLLKAIEPVNIEKTLFYAKKAEEASSFMKNKTVILLIGDTGVGKSTTLLYLMGCKMYTIKKHSILHIEADKTSIHPKYQKSIANINSTPLPRPETKYITGVTLTIDSSDSSDSDSSDSDSSNSQLNEVFLCEIPGFEYNSVEVDIVNGTGVIEAIKKAANVKIALLLSTPSLSENRMLAVINILHVLGRMIPNFDYNKRAFSYLFTKATQTTKDEISNLFTRVLDLCKNDVLNIDQAKKSIIKDIEKKTRKKTWVIDPVRTIKGTAKSKEILKDLMQTRGITSPSKVFQSYISTKSEEKLMMQLSYHDYAIQVALENQNFSLAAYKLYEVDRIKNLLKLSKINHIYKGIVDKARNKWNNIAKREQNRLEQELLFAKPMNSNIIDKYLKTYHLYNNFDLSLRKSHFPNDSTISNSFMIRLKKIAVALGMKISHHSFSEPEKTTIYLVKIKELAKKVKKCDIFLEKAQKILNKEMQKKKEKLSEFISKHQFEEASRILRNIQKSQIIQKEINPSILNIEKEYRKMQSYLLAFLEDLLKGTYQVLGLEYIKEKLQDQGNGPLKKVKQSSQANAQFPPYLFTCFNTYQVNQLKNYYTIIQKAVSTFRHSEVIPGITLPIMNLYDDYIKQNVRFIRASVLYASQLLEKNQEEHAREMCQLFNYLQELREMDDDIRKQTYYESYQMIECMNSFQRKKESKISNLIRQCFKDQRDQKQNAEDLTLYIKSVQNNQFLIKKEKEYKLRKLENSLLTILKKINTRVRFMDLSLDSDEDFSKLNEIIDVLKTISESKVGDLFKSIAKYEKIIFTQLTEQVISTVSFIEENFDRIRSNTNHQKELLRQLESFRNYLDQDQKLEKQFSKELKKMPEAITDEKSLKKAISSFNKDMSSNRKFLSEYEKEQRIKIDNNSKELAKINELIKIGETMKNKEVSLLNKIIVEKSNGRLNNIQEVVKLQKASWDTKKELEQETKNKKREIVNQLKKIGEQKNKYETVLNFYKERKEEISIKIATLTQEMNHSFLTIDKVQKLRDQKVDWIDDYIKDIKNRIKLSEKQKTTPLWVQMDIHQILSSIDYLKEVLKVDWIEKNSNDILGHSYHITYVIQRDLYNLKKSLKGYVTLLKKSMLSSLDTLSGQSNKIDDDYKDDEVIDYEAQIEAAKKLYKEFREVINWQKFYKKEVFDSYVTPYFMSKCEIRIKEVVEELEDRSRFLVRKGSLKEMINESKITRIISKLDSWIDPEEKKATKLFSWYINIIEEKISGKRILEKIKTRNYTLVNQEIKKFFKEEEIIKESGYSIKETIYQIKITLCSSVIELVDEVDSLLLNIQLSSKNNDLIDDKMIAISKLAKKISTAQSLFLKNQKSLLSNYKNELSKSLNYIKDRVAAWVSSREESIRKNKVLNQAEKVEKENQLLQKMKMALKGSPLI